MTAKLHINLSQGILDVEGDPQLVRAVYNDFKDRLLEGLKSAPPSSPHQNREPAPGGNGEAISDTASKTKTKRRAPAKKKTNSDEGGSGVAADSPKLDKNLDTSKLGAFYGKYLPKNNAEKILIFLKFMIEEVGIESPNTDQIYTCFKAAGEKIPKAFAQAFYDTSSKLGYIDFRSSIDFPITIVGDNHFNHTLKRKGAE